MAGLALAPQPRMPSAAAGDGALELGWRKAGVAAAALACGAWLGWWSAVAALGRCRPLKTAARHTNSSTVALSCCSRNTLQQGLRKSKGDPPGPDRTPLTPLGRTSSSLDLKASSWSVVISAEAANCALAWSSVLDTSACGGSSKGEPRQKKRGSSTFPDQKSRQVLKARARTQFRGI